MMFTNLFFSFLLSQNAHANLISGSEFSNTAETLEKGTFIIRPITPSSYGLTDSIELKLNLWDFELNENMTPWLGVEFQLLESQYLSFLLELSFLWLNLPFL